MPLTKQKEDHMTRETHDGHCCVTKEFEKYDSKIATL